MVSIRKQRHSHVEGIALHSEGEATPYLRIFRIWVGVFERAAGQNSLLVVVERDCTELLPI
jgi:hypothetical protein